ncbi:MAG TPA: AsmA-like C-terminal domain-containing protein [Candidatus Hydrogenedentes bacterium]|mgnify:CR=1 FL=1|nr:AsmA-like C-terminal domain-containing protein [Candidatus Hydrogenedentota bacterium]HPG70070.1 AsmA-like C-terminal domain-containing protein [Candidatus Hydrogenedentota bacterium]
MASSKPKRSTWRRWALLAVAALLVLAAAVGFLVLRFADPDRYRPWILGEIEKATGLPVAMGAIDFMVFPSLGVRVEDIALGENDFEARLGRVSARIRLADLRRRVLRITEVTVSGLAVTVPRDPAELARRIEAITAPHEAEAEPTEQPEPAPDKPVARPSKPEEPLHKPPFAVSIGAVRVDGTIRRGLDAERAAFVFSAEALEPLSDQGKVLCTATLPEFGDTARFEAELGLATQPAFSLGGRVDIKDLDLQSAVGAGGEPSDEVPRGLVSAEARIEMPDTGHVSILVSGGLDAPDVPALTGEFSAAVRYAADALNVDAVRFTSPSCQIEASAERSAEGELTAEVAQAKLGESMLDWLASLVPPGAVAVRFDDGAHFDASDAVITGDAANRITIAKGSLDFGGVAMTLEDGRTALANGRGRVRAESNRFIIEDLAADGLRASGAVTMDAETLRMALDLKADVELSRDQWAVFAPLDAVPEVEGHIAIARIAGTFELGKGVPEDLFIEGQIAHGRVVVDTETFKDIIRPIEAQFTTSNEAIKTTVRAQSEAVGAVTCDGRYAFSDHAWRGTVACDVERATTPFLGEEEIRELVQPVLAEFGASTFEVTFTAPTAEAPDMAIAASRRGAPRCAAHVVFKQRDDGYALGDVSAEASIPTKGVVPALPIEVTAADGAIDVRFAHIAEDAAYRVDADLTACRLDTTRHLFKRAGDAITVALAGKTDTWAPTDITVDLMGEVVPLHVDDGRVSAKDVDIDLGPLARLLPDGAKTSGRLRGSFVSEPLSADLVFANAQIVVTQDLAIESLSGALSYTPEAASCERLVFSAVGSQGVVTARWTPETWNGSLEAERVDANAIKRFVKEVQTLAERDTDQAAAATPADAPEATEPASPSVKSGERPKSPKPWPSGTGQIAVKELLYSRGQVQDIKLTAVTTGSELTLRDISMRPMSGRLTGQALFPLTEGGGRVYNYAHVALAFEDVDLQVVDDMVFEEPKGLFGRLSGTVDAEIPLGKNMRLVDDMSGVVAFEARQGSFGRMGFATKILTALKAVDIFRLRMPSFKDKGFTYDLCRGAIAMKHGVAGFEDLIVESAPLSMKATGVVDFPKVATDATVNVSLLESVAGILEHVPGIGSAVDKIQELASVTLVVQGTPEDPTVTIEAADKVRDLSEPVKGLLRTPVRNWLHIPLRSEPPSEGEGEGEQREDLVDEVVDAAAGALQKFLER